MSIFQIAARFSALRSDSDNDGAIIRAQARFLRFCWGRDHSSFGVLCFRRRGSDRFVNSFVPTSGYGEAAGLLDNYDRWEWDQYFCPNTFDAQTRRKDHARHTQLAWCDIDDADPGGFKPHPSFVWETSPGRFQAIWVWEGMLPPSRAEAYSRALAYRHGGDKSGWAVNKLLRLPGSVNHKPAYREPFIPLRHADATPIRQRPRLSPGHRRYHAHRPAPLKFSPHRHDRRDVLKKYRPRLKPSTRQLMCDRTVSRRDRSGCIYAMVADLHKAGASLDEIACVIWGSVYFRDKHGERLDRLQGEVTRILGKLEGGI